MATQTLIAGAGADDAAVGTQTWSNPGNITADDGAIAEAPGVGSTTPSHYLEASDFGFTIPAGATIDGIVVEVERLASVGGNSRDLHARLLVGGAAGSTNKADTVTAWPNVLTIASYGGAADLWGEALTPAIVNAADFGFLFSSTCTNTTTRIHRVDFIRITVHYTEGAGGVEDTMSASGGGSVSMSSAKRAVGGSISSVAGDGEITSFKRGLDSLSVSGGGTVNFESPTGNPQDAMSVSGAGTVQMVAAKRASGAMSSTGGGTPQITGSKRAADALAVSGGGTATMTAEVSVDAVAYFLTLSATLKHDLSLEAAIQ